MSKLKWYITVLFLIAMILVPIYMIFDNEKVGVMGSNIKLEIRQYDPYDYFRGRYLNVRPVAIETSGENLETILKEKYGNSNWANNKDCFVTFKTDANGMSIIDKVFVEAPTNTNAYIKAKIKHFYNNNVQVDYGIDKFFMNEDYSTEADNIIRNLPKEEKSYLVVKILDGKYFVDDLKIGDKSIYEYLDNK